MIHLNLRKSDVNIRFPNYFLYDIIEYLIIIYRNIYNKYFLKGDQRWAPSDEQPREILWKCCSLINAVAVNIATGSELAEEMDRFIITISV